MDWLKSLRDWLGGDRPGHSPGEWPVRLAALYGEAADRGEGYRPQLTQFETFRAIRALAPERQRELVFHLIGDISAHEQRRRAQDGKAFHWDAAAERNFLNESVLRQLLRCRLSFGPEELRRLFGRYRQLRGQFSWSPPLPAALLIRQLAWSLDGAPPEREAALRDLAREVGAPAFAANYPDGERAALLLRIDELLRGGRPAPDDEPVFRFDEGDPFGVYLGEALSIVPGEAREPLRQLLAHAARAQGGAPTERYRQRARILVAALGEETVTETLTNWFVFLAGVEPRREVHRSEWAGTTYEHVVYHGLAGHNARIVKGLLWIFADLAPAAPGLTRLVEWGYQSLPGQGPLAAGVANAAIYALGRGGLAGVAALSRLRLRLRQASARDRVDGAIRAAAAGLGLSPDVIEDMAVPEFGLEEGRRQQAFGEYTLELAIAAGGRVELQWRRADGRPQRAVPEVVKADAALWQRWSEARAAAAGIAKMLSAQRDRLDRSYIHDRQWAYADFRRYLLDHGLMGWLTRRLIWRFELAAGPAAAFFDQENWITVDGVPLEPVADDCRVRLWHPLDSPAEEVLGWRFFLEERQIRQPFKQAYREVYRLTDAERRTHTYSNRMAGHILKQHQFSSLAAARGWRYSLLGVYDDGRESEVARLALPAHQLESEYWIDEMPGEDAFNEAGIWLYVSTDQVRFSRAGAPLPLAEVPPLVFSEVMRDADLFTGVASVGNDPNWQDFGENRQRLRAYWQQYSFGDLTGVAQSRRAALERLLPRLRIADVAGIRGNFLVVQGKIRTYKIHIGSTNILMEPNDQYLCIVADRQKADAGALWLPFDGDHGLSVLISKALLLAADDQITDATITRQIRQR